MGELVIHFSRHLIGGIVLLAATAATAAADRSRPVVYDLVLNETNPESTTHYGRFTANDADIRAGGGALTSFEIDIDKDWWNTATDKVIENRFTAEAGAITGLAVSITDNTRPGGYGVRLYIYPNGHWSAGEASGDYAIHRVTALRD